jgi:DNA-binding response OmpR family regulator
MTSAERILIVDDNVATRYSVRRVLESRGFAVEEAGTGSDGRVRLADGDFDALVLDVNLPDMSGFDLVRELRAAAATSLLPVIHVSAASIATADQIAGLDAGADAYLMHPVDHDVLVATLRTLLRVRGTERALLAAEARFREMFDTVSAPIAAVGVDLGVRDANVAFRKLQSDVGGAATLADMFGDQPLVELQEALRTDSRWQGKFYLQTNSGLRVTEWRVTPYREPGVGLLYVEDYTEQHEREQAQRVELDSANTELAVEKAERERTELELVQAVKMDALGKLTGGIAHDFNNLLTGIIGALDMINAAIQSGEPERIPRYAEIAGTSASRAAVLVQRMLAFARKQSLDAVAFDVGERVESLSELLRRSVGENVAVTLDLPDTGLFAVADPNQLDNAVLNLAINARDAMKGRGRITISARPVSLAASADVDAGDYVSLSVSDNGPGIPAEYLEKVFEPFFTTKPIGEGTGLGLSMTYGFARQSGGTARVHSSEDGATIELLLPRADAVAAVVEAPAAAPATEGGNERILLVDDNEMVRMMALEVLEDAGYDVVECPEATSAMQALGAGRFDLLVTDVGLPGMSGRELADRARDQHPDRPVLFITGYAERAHDREEFLGERMDILPKPFNLGELLAAVRRSLG